jgi:hypothetical protein
LTRCLGGDCPGLISGNARRVSPGIFSRLNALVNVGRPDLESDPGGGQEFGAARRGRRQDQDVTWQTARFCHVTGPGGTQLPCRGAPSRDSFAT